MNVQLMNTYKPNQDQLTPSNKVTWFLCYYAYHSTMIWEVCSLQMVATYVQESSDILSNHHLCPR